MNGHDYDYADAMFERHLKKCKRCAYLEENRHEETCPECGDPWHSEKCEEFVEEITPHPVYGDQVMRVPCECRYSTLLEPAAIEKLQNQCGSDADEAAKTAYWDRTIDEALGK